MLCVCPLSASITPIFTLSSVSGESLDLLKVFFNIIPPLSNSKEQEELMQQLTEFQVKSFYEGYCTLLQMKHKYKDDFDISMHLYRWMRSIQFPRWGQWWEVLCTGQ